MIGLGPLSFLTPLAALVALVGLLPLVAFIAISRKARSVRSTLRLAEPGAVRYTTAAAVVTVAVLVGLAAAQPVFARNRNQRVRADAEAIFVFDISRSMLASGSSRRDQARSGEGRGAKPSPGVPGRSRRHRVAHGQDAPAPAAERGRGRISPDARAGDHRPAAAAHRVLPDDRDDARRTRCGSDAQLLRPHGTPPRHRGLHGRRVAASGQREHRGDAAPPARDQAGVRARVEPGRARLHERLPRVRLPTRSCERLGAPPPRRCRRRCELRRGPARRGRPESAFLPRAPGRPSCRAARRASSPSLRTSSSWPVFRSCCSSRGCRASSAYGTLPTPRDTPARPCRRWHD